MPNENGKLTDAEWEKVAEWIKSHPLQMHCPLCGNHEIDVGNQLVSPMPIKATAELASAQLYRLIAANLQEVPVNLFRERGGRYRTPDEWNHECPNCGHPLATA